MRIVLLGGAGYIGSVLSAHLVGQGHDVSVVDDLIYLRDSDGSNRDTATPIPPDVTFIRGDYRDEDTVRAALRGADAMVHLGGLVGEPACALDEGLSVELNFAAPVLGAELAVECGVTRMVFLSTCSVYGRQDGLVTEESEPNPLSCYAWTKLLAERRIAAVCAGRAELSVLRLSTVFGLSPRMRLDSVVNSMAARAAVTGKLPLRGGAAWRPLVHVADVARCVVRLLHDGHPRSGSHEATMDRPLVLNVGHDDNNHTIAGIADLVASRIPETSVLSEPIPEDPRDYRVSFARIAALLPGECQTPVTSGVDEIAAAVAEGRFSDPDALEFNNLRGLEAALREDRVRALRTPLMRRYQTEYDALRSAASDGHDPWDESAAARYWSDVRLTGIAPGDVAGEDAAVLCQGKPAPISAAYAGWELDCLAEMLPDLAGQRVVDLGCGVGRLLPVLAARAGQVVGVDLAPGMLARAARRIAALPNVATLRASACAVPLPSASVDAVVCLGVLEHLDGPGRTLALAEISRMLRVGGTLLLELNNSGSALLTGSRTDNPHRRGVQLDNGYFCGLTDVDATLATAAELGLHEVRRHGNPFYSTVRHAVENADRPDLAGLLEHARELDRGLGGSPVAASLVDQYMIALVKR